MLGGLLLTCLVVVVLACLWRGTVDSDRTAHTLLRMGNHMFEAEQALQPPPRGRAEHGLSLAASALQAKDTAKRRRGYLSPFLKKKIAYDQGWKCSCGCEKPLQPDFHIEHTVPIWKNGRDTRDNMTAMNPSCHAVKTAIENQRRKR